MFVVELAGLQAVVELVEELVEQVPLGLVVPVSGGAAGVEVAARAGGGAQRAQSPDRADGCQAAVFDVSVQHHGFLAAGAGDRRGPAKALSPRASAKRERSSPISASTRAPVSFPRPGKTSHGAKSQAATASGGRNAWASL